MKNHFTIPFFVPHEGCPFTCVFCSQKKISGKPEGARPSDIPAAISRHLATIPADSHVEVGFFGGSFTGLSHNRQAAFLKKAAPFLREGVINGIRLSTRPDLIDEERLDLLKKYGVTCIELGVQSMSNKVLAEAKRGHTLRDIEKASGLILHKGFILGHQIMVGLPNSSLQDEVKTAMASIAMRASQVRIYPVVVIKGTELANMWRDGSYAPLDEEEAIRRCARLIPLFERRGVRVIRCGLHPSEGLLSGKDILAGPFHPAFRQKVETTIYRSLFSSHFKKMERMKRTPGDLKKILYNPKDTAYVIGYGRANASYVEKLAYKKRIFFGDSSVPLSNIRLIYTDGKPVTLKR